MNDAATIRRQAIAEVAAGGDLIARFGITREELLEAAAAQFVEELRFESAEGLRGRMTIPLGIASEFLGISRDQIRRKVSHIDHGRRNQRLTLKQFDTLRDSVTVNPSPLNEI